MRAPIFTIAFVAALLLGQPSQAMKIRQFDKMADRDQADYIGDLIVGAENVLTNAGKPTLAAQVKRLFTTKLGNDRDTIGMVDFRKKSGDHSCGQCRPSSRSTE